MTDSQGYRPYNLDRLVRTVVSLLTMAAVVWLVAHVADVLVPLAIGLLLAYILDPLVRQAEKYLKSHSLSVFATVFVVAALAVLILWLVVPTISSEFRAMARMTSEAIQPDSAIRARLQEKLPEDFVPLLEETLKSDELREFVQDNSELHSAVIVVIKKVVPQLWGLLSGALAFLGVALQMLLVIVYLIFFLVDFRKFQASWQVYLPPQYRDSIVEFLDEFNAAMAVYFRGQFLIAATVGVLFAIGFSIVGLKMAVLLGLMIGLMNMVPYLQIAGIIPAVLLAVMTAVEQGTAVQSYLIGVVLVFVIVQILQDVLITPRIMGKVTGLRPVVILFCVFFWGKLLGFLGVLLAIPLTCLGLAYYRRMIADQALTLGLGGAR